MKTLNELNALSGICTLLIFVGSASGYFSFQVLFHSRACISLFTSQLTSVKTFFMSWGRLNVRQVDNRYPPKNVSILEENMSQETGSSQMSIVTEEHANIYCTYRWKLQHTITDFTIFLNVSQGCLMASVWKTNSVLELIICSANEISSLCSTWCYFNLITLFLNIFLLCFRGHSRSRSQLWQVRKGLIHPGQLSSSH